MNFFLSRGIVCRIEKYQIFGRKNRNIAQRESLQERKIPKKMERKKSRFFSAKRDSLQEKKIPKIWKKKSRKRYIAQRESLQERKIQQNWKTKSSKEKYCSERLFAGDKNTMMIIYVCSYSFLTT